MNQPQTISQRMRLHLNCGQNGHRYVFDIFVDNKPSGIQRLTSSKQGKKTDDLLCCGGAEFDLMGAKEGGAQEWILQYMEKRDFSA